MIMVLDITITITIIIIIISVRSVWCCCSGTHNAYPVYGDRDRDLMIGMILVVHRIHRCHVIHVVHVIHRPVNVYVRIVLVMLLMIEHKW